MEDNNVYCIIVTYNATTWIDKCLPSLRHSATPVHTVVVDNRSSDNTVSHIKENYPEVHLICNERNCGFGHANNQGLAFARKQGATHYLLLNQDAWIHPDTLERLISVQDQYRLGIVSPIHLNGEGDLFDFGFFEKVSGSSSGLQFFSSLLEGRTSKAYYECEEVNAAAWLISRQALETVGGFDPVFFHYYEDVNLLGRLRYHHLPLAVVPNAYMHHDRKKRHGHETTYRRNKVLNELLLTASDVNQSVLVPTLSRIKMTLDHCLQFLRSLVTLHWAQAARIVGDYLHFIGKLPAVIRHRRINRTAGPHWVDTI